MPIPFLHELLRSDDHSVGDTDSCLCYVLLPRILSFIIIAIYVAPFRFSRAS